MRHALSLHPALVALALLAAPVLSGCDALDLEQNPDGAYSPDNVFTSVAAAESVVDGIYTRTGELNGSRGVVAMGEAGFDIRSAGYQADFTQGDWTPLDGEFLNFWRLHYGVIGRANFALEGLAEADLPQDIVDRLTGEALFLRGYHYFSLARNFGGVPVFTTTETTDEALFPARAPVEAVYEQALADLGRAAELLPAFGAQRPGHVTRGSALGAIAAVHLQRAGTSGTADFQAACTAARTVIDEGQHSLVPDLRTLFSTASEQSSEWMYAYPANGQSGQSSNIAMQLTFPNNLNGRPNTFLGAGEFTRAGLNLVVDTLFFDKIFDKQNDRRWTELTWDQYVDPTNGDVVVFRKGYPATTKFYSFNLPPGSNYVLTDLDYPILRYAEVLLIAAEACNETGDTGYALAQLNKVRTRAGLGPFSGGQGEVRDEVIEERRRELYGEAERRYDLVRRGQFLAAAERLITRGREVVGNPAITNEHSEKTLLFPLPQQELDRNPNLTQNPGY